MKKRQCRIPDGGCVLVGAAEKLPAAIVDLEEYIYLRLARELYAKLIAKGKEPVHMQAFISCIDRVITRSFLMLQMATIQQFSISTSQN